MRIEIFTIQPTTPSTISSPFELVIFGGVGPGVSRLGDVDPVELEDTLAEDVDSRHACYVNNRSRTLRTRAKVRGRRRGENYLWIILL
jgi:hypothetical protein